MSGQLEPTNSPYAMAKLTAIELENLYLNNTAIKQLILCQPIFMDPMTIFLKWIAM